MFELLESFFITSSTLAENLSLLKYQNSLMNLNKFEIISGSPEKLKNKTYIFEF